MILQTRTSDAGSFSTWFVMAKEAITNDKETRVPCKGCNACCTSGFYIAVRKDEIDTLEHIPEKLLSEIPGMPELYFIGCTDQGHCPLLVDDLCSIYDHHPHSCKTFDCRIFTATGINLDKEDTSPINRRVKEWEFTSPKENDRIQHKELLRAVSVLKENLDPGSMDSTSENRRLLAHKAILLSERFE